MILSGLLIYSCQNEDEIPHQREGQEYLNERGNQKMMVLGKKLKNPYSVENMQKAWNNLRKSKATRAKTMGVDSVIKTTHLYIKFKPKNEDDLTTLRRDTTIVYFKYPLDYEIEVDGDYYRDPEVPLDQPTYQYASVEVGKQVLSESVEYEVLANLFIPDDDSDVQINTNSLPKTRSKLSEDTVDLLVYEALRITDNLEEEDKNLYSKTKGSLRSKWRPSGNITVSDDTLGKIGVYGVKVRATRWFTTHTGFVQTDGSFSCNGRFRGSARYRMDWERYHFALRDGRYSSAEHRGPYSRYAWTWEINAGAHKYYATIFRAAFHYYYKNIKDLRKPPLNGTWKVQLRIRAYLQNGSSSGGNPGTHSTSWTAFGLSSPVKIYTYRDDSKDTYATTIHELAHASHYNANKSAFRGAESKVKESWAIGVERELTRMVYPNYIPYYVRLRYTGVVQDMTDGIKTTFSYVYLSDNGSQVLLTKSYQDRVSGYTIRQIEDVLIHQRTWDGWKNNIKNKYSNATESNLDETFNYWDSQ